MPQEEAIETKEEETLRKGRPVIKTTIEMDRELYYKVKEEVVKKHMSLKDFMSRAAHEKLERGGRPMDQRGIGLGILMETLEDNPFSSKVLSVLQTELPHPFGITVLVSKAQRYGVEIADLAPSDLTDEFIADLTLPIDFISGPEVASKVRRSLVDLRGG
jgi:hypothetical protein